ncbi:MAG: hypothetical protein QOE99_2017 [Actinomycetota bacterium]|nr:hypothetical protein [Actinomycetota bacterium]
MTDGPRHAGAPGARGVLGATLVVGLILDLFCLLFLPVRLGGHLIPFAPILVLIVNAVISRVATSYAHSRSPATVLMGVAILVAFGGASRGPGGDLLVTRDLEGMFFLFVLTACLGAALPLFRRRGGA